MRAVVFENGQVRVERREVPEPAAGEALVRVLRAGICDTDLQLREGYMGFSGIPGHEFVGRIEAAEEAPTRVGQLVVGEINAACGECPRCAAGFERHCRDRTVLGILGRPGAFADYLTLPLSNLHEVPRGMPLERAVFVEPVAAAFEIPEQLAVGGRSVLVMGAGKLGSLCARVLQQAGAKVTVMARRQATLDPLAADGFAILQAPDPPPRWPGAADAPRFDLVVEATGSPQGLPQALSFVRPRGTLVLKTTCAADLAVNLASVVIDEITVVGSRCGPFEPAIDALAAGRLTPEDTIGGRWPLEGIEAAMAAAADPPDPARRKMLLEIWE